VPHTGSLNGATNPNQAALYARRHNIYPQISLSISSGFLSQFLFHTLPFVACTIHKCYSPDVLREGRESPELIWPNSGISAALSPQQDFANAP